jgi:hypothetical protein
VQFRPLPVEHINLSGSSSYKEETEIINLMIFGFEKFVLVAADDNRYVAEATSGIWISIRSVSGVA